MRKTLLSFGHGFSAQALAADLMAQGWDVIGTTRDPAKADAIAKTGAKPLLWGEAQTDQEGIPEAIARASHVLVSAAPTGEGDPVLTAFGAALTARAGAFEWLGYLSTTGVYGDHAGGWVDENSPLTPSTARGKLRVAAETQWREIPNLPLHIFRLAGIYGPGRGPFAKVRAGTARRIIKNGQVFSRCHVADIAQVLAASITAPNPGAAYNICDDDPAPPEDVIAFAADLLNLPVPPAEDFETAEMTPMARSFYAESKRVDNTRIKEELGVRLLYPTYRDGLRALLGA